MKKIFLLLIFPLFLLFPSISFAADEGPPAGEAGWTIKSFDVTALVFEDAHLEFQEKIAVGFDGTQKHGIYREIPYIYHPQNASEVRLDFANFKVVGSDGKDIPFELSLSGDNKKFKIGDPDKTISGEQIYNISYAVRGALNTFADHDELYWNVTGSSWPVPIETSTFKIVYPEVGAIFKNQCFVGEYGSQEESCTIAPTDAEVDFVLNRSLATGEGWTAVAGINKGVVSQAALDALIAQRQKEAAWLETWRKIKKAIAIIFDFIPLLVLILMFVKWRREGRDSKDKCAITPEFAPPGKLPPGELGVLWDQKTDMKDISATIVDLAVKGYLKIREIQKGKIFKSIDYEFEKFKEADEKLKDYEKKILEGIFGGAKIKKLSDLKNHYYRELPEIKKSLYCEVVTDKLFEKDPEKARSRWFLIGILVLVFAPMLGFVMGLILASMGSGIWAGLASGIIILIFAPFMPRRAERGRELFWQSKGFKLYMETAEKYRQKFYEAQNIFERFLPYAMVFGIVEKWAQAFEGLNIKSPGWFEGQGTFAPIVFAASLDNMGNSMSSALASSPSSSAAGGGSGFSGGGSGGGFGGGGGGSW